MLEKANAVVNRKVAGNIEEEITVNGYRSIYEWNRNIAEFRLV